MHQINDATLYIWGTKIKKNSCQLRWFDKAQHEWCSLETQEGLQTSKGPITQYVAK